MNLIGWIGGKHYLAKEIIKLMPYHRVYVEVFGGGASVLFKKMPSRVEVYNDINKELVNLLDIVKNRLSEFIDTLKWTLNDVERIKRYKEEEDEIKRAVLFYLRLNYSYNNKEDGTFSRLNYKGKTFREIKKIIQVRDRLRYVIIENLDFRELIKKYDREYTLFYLDPPYWNKKSGEAGYYSYDFTERDHIELRDILGKIRGKFILSYNDREEVRELYKDFRIYETEVIYPTPTGAGVKATRKKELIILNY